MKNKLLSITLTVLFATTIAGCASETANDALYVSFENIETAQTAENPVEKEHITEEQKSETEEQGNIPEEQGNIPKEQEDKSKEQQNQVEEPKSKTEEPGSVPEEQESTNSAPEIETPIALTFADLSERQFEFSSGAGAWAESFTIEKDGYFTGSFHDTDMGGIGEGYAYGTIYSSSYSGYFTDLTQINDYTYTMKLADISYKEPIDTVEIIDELRYIYTDSYCLGDTDTFTIYLPGTPWDELSEEVRTWLFMVNQSESELTMIAIVDEINEYGIYSYDRQEPLEEAQMTFDSYKISYDYYGEKLSAADTTLEMVEYSGTMYELSDECLNYIWNLVRYNVDENDFDEILAEQRAWILEKEAKAKEISAEYAGGSFAAVSYNDTLATLTMERCEELIAYLK